MIPRSAKFAVSFWIETQQGLWQVSLRLPHVVGDPMNRPGEGARRRRFARLGRIAYRHRNEVHSDCPCCRRFRNEGLPRPLLHAFEGCYKRKGKPLAREGRKATGLSESAGSPEASYRSLEPLDPLSRGLEDEWDRL